MNTEDAVWAVDLCSLASDLALDWGRESCNRPRGGFWCRMVGFRHGLILLHSLITLISPMGNLFSPTPSFESSTLLVSISRGEGFGWGCTIRCTISQSSFHSLILIWLNAMELM